MITSALAFIAMVGLPHTGFSPAETSAIESSFRQYAQSKGAHGGALIVTNGSDTVTVPFGVRNEKGDPFLATTPNRVASVSKTYTTTAVLCLVRDGKLNLDDFVLDILNKDREHPIKPRQAEMRTVTVRHLLQHTGGWGSDTFLNEQVTTSKRYGTPLPIPKDIQVLLAFEKESLVSTPGTRFSYSNIGFRILGKIIEKVSGRGYEDYVRAAILAPAGISATEAYVGHSKNLREGETRYWDLPGRVGMSLYPGDNLKRVPFPYGCYTLGEMDSSGGWVMSARALIQFQQALPKLISAELQAQVVIPPAYARGSRNYTGLGFSVTVESNGGYTLQHGGSLEGCNAAIMYRANGQLISVVFNSGGMPKDNYWAQDYINQVLCPLLNQMGN